MQFYLHVESKARSKQNRNRLPDTENTLGVTGREASGRGEAGEGLGSTDWQFQNSHRL